MTQKRAVIPRKLGKLTVHSEDGPKILVSCACQPEVQFSRSREWLVVAIAKGKLGSQMCRKCSRDKMSGRAVRRVAPKVGPLVRM